MSKNSYGGMITREQFCFYETRTVARLILEGKSEKEALEEIVQDNLFQYPTERSLTSIGKACYKRMEGLKDERLVNEVAYGSAYTARQICLYAMMIQYPIVRDFMTRVIGEKYRCFDMNFGQIDLNSFFIQLRSSNEEVAGWSEATVERVKAVLKKLLVDNEYLDSNKADHLNPVLIESVLEESIRERGDNDSLLAFNCLF